MPSAFGAIVGQDEMKLAVVLPKIVDVDGPVPVVGRPFGATDAPDAGVIAGGVLAVPEPRRERS